MYLKDRPTYRRRKGSPLPILLIALVALLAVGYVATQQFDLLRNPFETPTPAPTSDPLHAFLSGRGGRVA